MCLAADDSAGLIIHRLSNRAWVIFCCWTFHRSDEWVVTQLKAWRRAVRRTRQSCFGVQRW